MPPHQEPHPLSKRSGATSLPRSMSLPDSLKTHEALHYQGLSSIGATTVAGGPMHPSLTQPVTVDPSSLHLRAPCMSTPASPQTNHHNTNIAGTTSTKSSPSVTISPLVTANALNTPSTSYAAEDVSTYSAPPGMRIRKTGLQRTHACDQCSQCE